MIIANWFPPGGEEQPHDWLWEWRYIRGPYTGKIYWWNIVLCGLLIIWVREEKR